MDNERPWCLEEVGDYCRWLGMDAAPAAALVEAAALVRSTPALAERLKNYHALIFGAQAPRPLPNVTWPQWPSDAGPVGRLFEALVILSGLPGYRQGHAARGIPAAVTKATLADIQRWMRHYRQRHGVWGFNQGSWLLLHVGGQLVELGRLQFAIGRNPLRFVVLREKPPGSRVLALAQAHSRFRRDGRFHDTCGTASDDPGWIASFQDEAGRIVGHPVLSTNVVAAQPITLQAEQWQVVLRPGDPILDVHIPASGPLAPGLLDDAFAQAAAFFPRYFPEHAFTAFTCISWLMDPQLCRCVPGSNIAGFAARFQAVPVAHASDAQMWERVFDVPLGTRLPLDQAPRDTALRRALLMHLQAGGQWWECGGFVLHPQIPRHD